MPGTGLPGAGVSGVAASGTGGAIAVPPAAGKPPSATDAERAQGEWVPLAEVARPHGVRGELRLRLFNKDSDTLLEQDEVLVRLPDGAEHEVSVDAARRADDAILMKLHSVDDRDRADDLRGSVVCVRRRDFPALAADEFYEVDVVGAAAMLDGARVGEVVEILTYPSVSALRIRADQGGHWEVPLVEAFVRRVSAAERIVELVTLEDVELEVPKVKKPRPVRPDRRGRQNKERAAAAVAPRDAAASAAAGEPDDAGDAESEADPSGAALAPSDE